MCNANATRAETRREAAYPLTEPAWGCGAQVTTDDLALALTYLYFASLQALGRWLQRIGEVVHG